MFHMLYTSGNTFLRNNEHEINWRQKGSKFCKQ